MDDRYSRQKLFYPIGNTGQTRLLNKHVLIVGAGALGASNAESLVRAGIGKLTIIDRDYVEWSNLQRQQLYTEQDAKNRMPKAIAAKDRLTQMNSEVDIQAFVMDATSESLSPLLKGVDIAIDATDNFDIRMIMNDLMQKHQIPWIYGSCVGSTGMSYTIIPGETPCLHCLLHSVPMNGATCDTSGIISPAVQMVTAHQTVEALKLLVEDHSALRKGLLTFDVWNNQSYTMNVQRAKKADCPSCGHNPIHPYLQYDQQTKVSVLCGRDTVQIRPSKQALSLDDLEKKLSTFGEMKRNPYLLSLTYETYRIVFFQDGRAFVHGTNDIDQAKSIYYRLVG
ncbi:adenylyltransferase/sulfurtransferase [Bacillus ectoiniformans]|uniref:MoeB/ThiF family adenylyltransferase n=1 Tax=Bacillus ectoiniformans TaxID=1494429 RepID=UPI00195E43FE|nr:MoeB/ThiF family adenylyltransferase [Bacillus ectoiniformans]MBM7649071.1 adenylyltransferase/sulfurtransferase [Bacillus ectoiniformans]